MTHEELEAGIADLRRQLATERAEREALTRMVLESPVKLAHDVGAAVDDVALDRGYYDTRLAELAARAAGQPESSDPLVSVEVAGFVATMVNIMCQIDERVRALETAHLELRNVITQVITRIEGVQADSVALRSEYTSAAKSIHKHLDSVEKDLKPLAQLPQKMAALLAAVRGKFRNPGTVQ